MKKLISLSLTVLMIFSLFTFVPTKKAYAGTNVTVTKTYTGLKNNDVNQLPSTIQYTDPTTGATGTLNIVKPSANYWVSKWNTGRTAYVSTANWSASYYSEDTSNVPGSMPFSYYDAGSGQTLTGYVPRTGLWSSSDQSWIRYHWNNGHFYWFSNWNYKYYDSGGGYHSWWEATPAMSQTWYIDDGPIPAGYAVDTISTEWTTGLLHGVWTSDTGFINNYARGVHILYRSHQWYWVHWWNASFGGWVSLPNTPAEYSCTVQYTGTINLAPIAQFSMPSTAYTGESVPITNYSYDKDGKIVSSVFTFNPTSGQNNLATKGSVSFNAPGTYSVTLTVKDDNGAVASITKTILIKQAPTATISLVGVIRPPNPEIPLPYIYPAEPYPIKAGYYLTMDFQAIGAKQMTIEFYRDGVPISVYSYDNDTKNEFQNYNEAVPADGLVSKRFFLDPQTPKDSIISVKVSVTDGFKQTTINQDVFNVCGSALEDTSINQIE